MTAFNPFRVKRPSAEWLALQRLLRDHSVRCQQHPDWWISETPEVRAIAAQICVGCPLTKACRAVAVADRMSFIWGGQDYCDGTPMQPLISLETDEQASTVTSTPRKEEWHEDKERVSAVGAY